MRRTRTEPYLVQRVMTLEEPRKAKGVDALFGFDYMGSAEFEFGALPEALKLMRSNKNKLVVEKIKPLKGAAVYFVGRKSDLAAATAWLNKHLLGETREKEATYMGIVLGIEEQRFDPRCDGWWALDTEVPWAMFTTKDSAEKWQKSL